MLLTILATIVVLGVLILVHELGHFVAAKAVDIEVPRFSIGIGPKAFGFRRGETEYVVSWLPLGGYVKMAGMADEEATAKLEGGMQPERVPSSRDFEAKPLWARTMVILAGVTMNWLFAIVAFSVLALQQGVVEPRVQEILEGSPAETIGLREGDLFLTVAGMKVRSPAQVTMAVEGHANEEIPLAVERNGEVLFLRAIPEPVTNFSELANDSVTIGRLGVMLGGEESLRAVALPAAIKHGWDETVYWTVSVVSFLRRLFLGESSVKELGGPIMIGQISGEAARAGFWSLLSFMAVISINLAVLNLLPIPVLDGGHMVFLAIEGLRGRALSVEQRIRWTTVGMVVVVGLMVYAIGNDLFRIFR